MLDGIVAVSEESSFYLPKQCLFTGWKDGRHGHHLISTFHSPILPACLAVCRLIATAARRCVWQTNRQRIGDEGDLLRSRPRGLDELFGETVSGPCWWSFCPDTPDQPSLKTLEAIGPVCAHIQPRQAITSPFSTLKSSSKRHRPDGQLAWSTIFPPPSTLVAPPGAVNP